MNVVGTRLPGVLVFEPIVRSDPRGGFVELFHSDRYSEFGIPTVFRQDNLSVSVPGVLRGLHYQWPSPQGKLVTCLAGVVDDVVVDLRRGSPTYGEWVMQRLDGEARRQIYAPPGFGHGFVVRGEAPAVVAYKCTAEFRPEADRCVRWDDPEIGVDWGVREPLLSARDASSPWLGDLGPDDLPSVLVLPDPHA